MKTSRMGLIGLVSAAAMLVPACATSQPTQQADGQAVSPQEWKPKFVDGELQPLSDGFPDHQITFVVVDKAGSRDGLFVQALQKVLADISPVDIRVSYEPATQGGTMYALANVKTRRGGVEGYWPIVVDVIGSPSDFLISPITKDTGLTLDDTNIIIGTEVHPYVLVQRGDAPWGNSFEEFVKYARAHPGELRYISQGVGSGPDIGMEWMLNGLDIEVKKVPVAGAQEAVAAVGAGEGDFTMVRPDAVVAPAKAGRVDPIFFSSDEVPQGWADRPGVASANDYDKFGLSDAPWAIVEGVMLPDKTSDLHDRWLYALLKAAYETEQYRELRKTIPGLQFELINNKKADRLARKSVELAEPIVREAGLHYEQN